MRKQTCRDLCVLTCLSQIFTCVLSGAILEVQMISYANPTGSELSYSYCDERVLGDYWKCDTVFHFCIDKAGDSNTNHCAYFAAVTRIYQDQNNIVFGTDMKTVKNPIKIHFDAWPGSVRFKLMVVDKDAEFDDKIDAMNVVLKISADRSISQSQWSDTQVIEGLREHEPSTVSLKYRVYCLDNYYNTTCGRHCVRTNGPRRHTLCDAATGAEVCQTEWEGPDCNVFSDDCIDNNCTNGATCKDGHRQYTCTCVPGFTGRFCETNINECASEPCFNGGTCTDAVNAFNCSCKRGYFGSTCSQNKCDRDNSPCLNNGTCFLSNKDEVRCACPKAYTGDVCQREKCSDVHCMNLGTCKDGFCICRPGYLGIRCDVNRCEMIACMNGATCTDGKCSCAPGYTDRHCSIKINGRSGTDNQSGQVDAGKQNGDHESGRDHASSPGQSVQGGPSASNGQAGTAGAGDGKTQTRIVGQGGTDNGPGYTGLQDGAHGGGYPPKFGRPTKQRQRSSSDQATTPNVGDANIQAHTNGGPRTGNPLPLPVGIMLVILMYNNL